VSVLDDKLKLLPDKPGVYVMLDKDGQIIYVGKAKNLKNRVRQYFFNSVKTDKVMAMVSNVADFYYIIAPSEIDALSLENNLIKKHKPRYNILLKDDKTYPYIRVDLREAFPTFKVTRKIKKDGAKYFGPYMGGVSVRSVIELLNLAFGVRPCEKVLDPKKPLKPCLNYHIKKCTAPCSGAVDKEEYLKSVDRAMDFLAGDVTLAKDLLKQKMLSASMNEEFELALKYRENLFSLDKIALKRLTALNKFISADVIACRSNGIYMAVSLLVVRSGRMLGGKNFSFNSIHESDAEALKEFMLRYYDKSDDFPEEVITEVELDDSSVLEKYFKDKFDKDLTIIHAKQGVRRQLLDMAGVNASEHLEVAVDKIKHKDDMTVSACAKLKEILNLKNYPKRIECYDISNISGVDKVGSMVVFNDGEPDRESYRRFKIKTVEGADDFKSLKEVLERRFERLKTDPEKFPKPDLMVIDGGKGQLSAICEVFERLGVSDIDLISLAEREEEIFTLKSKDPVVLSKSDYCLRMLIRLRDEAHRFAITYHRSLRGKRALSSVLDGVRGLGKVKKRALLERFKDVGGIALATKEQLVTVEGIGEALADTIIEVLNKEGLR